MADLFLSYSPKDAEIAHKIAHSLESKGSSVFYDRRDSLDTNDLQVLDQEMGQASWIIVLWSRNALEDGRITYEAMYAREKNNLLSVQVEPNSIPTEYSNAQSPDHVNYQNQLTLIIQQALSPESVTPEAPVSAPLSQPQEQEIAHSDPAKTVSQGQPQNTPTVSQVEEAPKVVPAATEQPQVNVTAPEQAQNPTPPANAPNIANTEQSPRQNLQKRLAETTQGSAPIQSAAITANKIGQPVAPAQQAAAENTVIRRDLPNLPTNTGSKIPAPAGQPAVAPAIAAASQGKTSKLVPMALMSVGTLLLAAVGGGYWYLANNSPASAIQKNYKILEPQKVEATKPVKVAMVKVEKPRLIRPSIATAESEPKKSATPPKDDILSSLLASAPQRPVSPEPSPVAKTPAPQQVSIQAAGLSSAERGAKSISQCLGCHSFKKDQPNKTGPNLYGVMNQLIGSERKFNYSDTLRSMGAIGEVWSKEQLDCYLKNPAVCMPGTKMGFTGIKGHRKRNDIIAYLSTLKQ